MARMATVVMYMYALSLGATFCICIFCCAHYTHGDSTLCGVNALVVQRLIP